MQCAPTATVLAIQRNALLEQILGYPDVASMGGLVEKGPGAVALGQAGASLDQALHFREIALVNSGKERTGTPAGEEPSRHE